MEGEDLRPAHQRPERGQERGDEDGGVEKSGPPRREKSASATKSSAPAAGSQAGRRRPLSKTIATGSASAATPEPKPRASARGANSRSVRAAAIPGAAPKMPAASAINSENSYPR